jgi:hypothetical protein
MGKRRAESPKLKGERSEIRSQMTEVRGQTSDNSTNTDVPNDPHEPNHLTCPVKFLPR